MMPKDKIVELFGLPGSGKSTYAKKNSVKEEMASFKVVGNLWFKIFVHFSLGRVLAPKAHKHIYFIYRRYLKKENKFGFSANLSMYLNQMIYVYWLKKMTQNKKRIFDEGIIHRLIAIEAEYGVDHVVSLKAWNYLDEFHDEIYYVRVNTDTALSRIKKRNRKYSSMDYLSDIELRRFLNEYYMACERFSKDIKRVRIIDND